jgi:hypothetical protein
MKKPNEEVLKQSEDMRKALTGFIPQENVEHAMKAVHWMIVKGHITQEEYLFQFAQYVPNAVQMLKEVLGVDYAIVKSWMDNQMVATSVILPKLVELIKSRTKTF